MTIDTGVAGRRVLPLPFMVHSGLAFALGMSVLLGASPKVWGELDLSYRVEELDLEPAVQIKRFPNRTVEEYRINGNLYMIKITPKAGAPYYLVDDTGSGELEFRRDDPSREHIVPRWTLMTW